MSVKSDPGRLITVLLGACFLLLAISLLLPSTLTGFVIGEPAQANSLISMVMVLAGLCIVWIGLR